MAFKDYGDHVAVIGPDGKKYVYQADYLEQAVVKMEAAEQAVSSPGTTKQAKRKAPAKRAARPAKRGTGKPATRTSSPTTTEQGSTKTSTKKVETKE